MKVGFVGLGLMGLPMAERLIAAGNALFVSSGNQAAAEAVRAAGGTVLDNVAAVAREVDVFCSCRVTPAHSQAVFLGDDGVVSHGKAGTICIDFATIDPATSRNIAAELGQAGMPYIDAPVSGGPDGAVAGTLSIIAGGPQHAIDAARPLFDAVGKRVFHLGDSGAGVMAKLCNNMISITTHALVAEAMVLGTKAGLDPRALYEVLYSSSGYSRTLERVVPNHFLTRNFEAAATVETVKKDLECAIDTARALGVRLVVPNSALQCYVETVGLGHADKDIASVILPMEAIAGVKVGPA